MPTCVRCGKWCAPSQGVSACPACGGELGSGDALQRAEAKAATLGMTLVEYEQHEADERQRERDAWEARYADEQRAYAALPDDEKEARAAREGTLIASSDDAFAELTVLIAALIVAFMTGAVLFVIAVLVGRSPAAVIAGTIGGAVGGAILLPVIYFGAIAIFSRVVRPVADRRTARRVVCYAFNAVMVIAFLLPMLLTMSVSLLLW